MKPLQPADFISLNVFQERGWPIEVDLVYAKPDHPENHFPNLYHPEAKLLWAHRDLAPVILLSSALCKARYGWKLAAHDCMRPVQAQAKMAEYGYPEELVSRPGMGAHPRGMSIDFLPIGVDMGTPYDYFAEDLNNNPAARDTISFPGRTENESAAICQRRADFEEAVWQSANALGQDILLLPEEWWDFRFQKEGSRPGSTYWGDYEPVNETTLPAYMHLVGRPEPAPSTVQHEWAEYAVTVERAVRKRARQLLGANPS
ncbi:MAG: hypothetical protein SFW62_05365 [Alphaproteobacteria bacterium]|nr:hypothetical protein [Alphaproteobacteria bacterium]